MASSRSRGPEHQERPAPGQSRGIGRRIALGLVVAWVVWWWGWLHPGSHPFTTLLRDGLLVGALVAGYRFLAARAVSDRESDVSIPASVASSLDPLGSVRDHAAAAGGGAYLGANRGAWVFADPEHGVLLLGPPRSGKTSGVVIPALLAAPGACVSTSTKLDVLHATLAARRRSGDVWLFDPTGEHADAGVEGVRRLSWSPVAAAGSWDEALLMARAPSERERELVDDALAEIQERDATVRRPRAWFVLDEPDFNAAAFGDTMMITTFTLEDSGLTAVIAQ